jgi:thiol-disulfide isomerase/thioredoxin
MKQIVLSVLIVTGFLFTSCNRNAGKQKADVIAEINGIEISSSELDKLVQQELFDELNRIYNIRDLALTELVSNKVLEQEAAKHNKSVPDFLRAYTDSVIGHYSYDSLVAKYNLDTPAAMLYKTSMMQIPPDTYEGRLNQRNKLEYIIRSRLTDSLINKGDVKRFLYPPKSPGINMGKQAISYRGNMESDVTLYLISDFDCGKCIGLHPVYDSLYNKYRDKVRFGYVNYSGTASPLIIASEAMNNQGKFWEFYNTVFKINAMIDSARIFNIADSLRLDMDKFTADFNSWDIANKITENFNAIEAMGIYATPTVIVNDRLLFNSGSYDEIARLIDIELDKR